MEQLKGEILQYEDQLSQIQFAISASPECPEKVNLIALESDIKELIKLTKQSLLSSTNSSSPADPLEAEYSLFKAEVDELNLDNLNNESYEKENSEPKINFEDLNANLKALEGIKCQAPYKHLWSNDVTYHNALLAQVVQSNAITKSDEIKVKVLFTNPTHQEMLPCPYYLEGSCKFGEEKCRFSHGEVVSFNSLKEYREPDFSQLSIGCRVFAKLCNNLWQPAIVITIDGLQCTVKLESSSKEENMCLHDILPLNNSEGQETSFDDDVDDNSEDNNLDNGDKCNGEGSLGYGKTMERIFSVPPPSMLGEWEKFTKGFGSRIMSKMGYIHGHGLGLKCNGRIEPVPAVILPPGKSLDHCMMLREHAGKDKNLFGVERKIKKMQQKHEEALSRAYEREKKRTDVFTFMNNKLGQTTSFEPSQSTSKEKRSSLQKQTTRGLNVTSFHLAEEMRKTEREIKCLNQSLERQSSQSQAFQLMKDKLEDRKGRLRELQESERKISNEQEQRRDRKKLSVF